MLNDVFTVVVEVICVVTVEEVVFVVVTFGFGVFVGGRAVIIRGRFFVVKVVGC